MQQFQRPALSLVFLLFLCLSLSAQNDSVPRKKDSLDFYDMSLEQLLKIKAHGVPSELEKLINSLISVASKKPLSTRESPSIVSLITEDEIKKSGARDLIDVLRMVPGFDFGVDVEGVVGLGLRGNWGHEGKILVLLDGQETNEILYATTQFGNHYPIDHIKRIEIIRGPGSAIYGGFAEYGVVNIITKQGEDINGEMASVSYGTFDKTYARQNLSFATGEKVKNFQYSLSGTTGLGNRSDRDYKDFEGNQYNMSPASGMNPLYLNTALSYKNFSARCIADFYETTMRDSYGTVVNRSPVVSHFNSVYTELKYAIKAGKSLTITPRFNYKSQTPWQSDDYEGKEAYHKTAERATGNITASYNLNRKINIVGGAEFYHDAATDKTDSSYFSSGGKSVSYYNTAFFTQGMVKTRLVNIILGARYDKHNIYGSAFVPRVGLTKKI